MTSVAKNRIDQSADACRWEDSLRPNQCTVERRYGQDRVQQATPRWACPEERIPGGGAGGGSRQYYVNKLQKE